MLQWPVSVPLTNYGNSIPQDLKEADMNGDKKSDIILLQNRTAYLFIGNENGSLNNGVIITNGVDGLVIGDFNKDLFSDLITYHKSSWNFIDTYLGWSDAGKPKSYGKSFYTRIEGWVEAIVAGDFIEDEIDDIAIARNLNGNGEIAIFSGNGDGTFKTKYSYSANSKYPITGLIAKDIDGDKHLDIVAYNAANGRILAFLGNGDGTLNFRADYLLPPFTHLLADDLYGNGHPDLIATHGPVNPKYPTVSRNSATVFENLGNGYLRMAGEYPAGNLPYSTAIHTNSQGQKYIIVANIPGGFTRLQRRK